MSSAPLPVADAGFPGARILVVDDDMHIARTLCGLLGLYGWHATAVGSGEEALDALAGDPFDVVLLDVRLPGIDGFETCEAIRARYGPSLPVVLITAMGDRLAQRRGYDAGADEFLAKPIDGLTLVLKLRVFLRLKALHDETARHREDAQQRLQGLAQLNAMGQEWSLVARPEDFYRVVTQRLATLIRARICLLALWDARTRTLSAVLPAHGLPDELTGRLRYTVRPEHRSLWNFGSGRPYLSNHARTDSRLVPEMVAALGVASVVLVPMISEGRFLGLLVAGDRVGGFDDAQLQILTTFAGPAATFLRSREIFDQQVRHATRLQVFAELSGALGANLERAALLDVALSRLVGQLGYAAAAFHGAKRGGLELEMATGEAARLDPELPRWTLNATGPLPSAASAGEEIAAPVRAGDRVLGVLAVRRPEGSSFEEAETSLIAGFAGQLAVALQRAEVTARTGRLALQMATLYELGLETASQRDLRQLFSRAAAEAGRLIDADQTSVLRLRAAAGLLEPFAAWAREMQAGFQETGFRIGEGIAGRVARDRMPALVNEPEREADFIPRPADVARLACIPITCFDQGLGETVVFGVLCATRRDGRAPFTAEDLDDLTRFASQLSIAAGNALAFAAERARSEQLVLVNTLLREIAGSLSRERVLETAVRRIHESFAWPAVFLVVPDREAGVNRVLLARGQPAPPEGWQNTPLQSGLSARVLREGVALVVPQAKADPEAAPRLATTRSMLLVPVHSGTEVAAVLEVESDAPGAFSRSEVLTLETLADGIGICLRNAELYAAVERTNEQLVELDRTKTDLVNIVAHDFRAPLAGVVGNAELLADAADDAERDELARAILGSAQHLASMVNNTLETTRLDSGQFAFDFGVVELGAVVRNVVGRQPPDERQRITVETPEDPLPCWADPGRLTQVLENLLANAIRYSPDGGNVRVRVARAGEEAAVEVSDEGIGIDSRHVARLFRPFSRVREGRAGDIEGTGLGLYICDRIVRAHGGTLGVESTPGRGSTFRFTVPVYGLAAQTEAPVLLVAVTEETFRRELRHVGHELGFRVVDVADGVEAVEVASRVLPAAVVADRVLPRLGAAEVARRLKEGRSTRNIPVLALSEGDDGVAEGLFHARLGRAPAADELRRQLAALRAV